MGSRPSASGLGGRVKTPGGASVPPPGATLPARARPAAEARNLRREQRRSRSRMEYVRGGLGTLYQEPPTVSDASQKRPRPTAAAIHSRIRYNRRFRNRRHSRSEPVRTMRAPPRPHLPPAPLLRAYADAGPPDVEQLGDLPDLGPRVRAVVSARADWL